MTTLATQGAFGHPIAFAGLVLVIFALLLNIPGLIEALKRNRDDD
jgi:hypothetical protein